LEERRGTERGKGEWEVKKRDRDRDREIETDWWSYHLDG